MENSIYPEILYLLYCSQLLFHIVTIFNLVDVADDLVVRQIFAPVVRIDRDAVEEDFCPLENFVVVRNEDDDEKERHRDREDGESPGDEILRNKKVHLRDDP